MTPEERYHTLHEERVSRFNKKQVGKMKEREDLKEAHYECTKAIEYVKDTV